VHEREVYGAKPARGPPGASNCQPKTDIGLQKSVLDSCNMERGVVPG
jgi:hypothetical protein